MSVETTAGGITVCLRCGKPGQGGPGNPEARIGRRATEGLCADCCVTEFFQQEPVVSEVIAKVGARALLAPHVREQFGRILASGNADLPPGEIDWARVVRQWDLPFPGRQRKAAGR